MAALKSKIQDPNFYLGLGSRSNLPLPINKDIQKRKYRLQDSIVLGVEQFLRSIHPSLLTQYKIGDNIKRTIMLKIPYHTSTGGAMHSIVC